MKKAVSIVIIGLILLTAVSTALASATVSVSKQTAEPGDIVTISGTVNADENITIKIVDGAGSIVYFGAVRADGSGNYSSTFTVPADIADGTLTVTVGSGSDTAIAKISVVASPAPTARPTVTPTEKPTARPTMTPTEKPTMTPTEKPTARPTVTPTEKPTAQPTVTTTERPTSQPTATSTERPTGNSEEQTATSAPAKGITPIEAEQDKKTGNITILIDIGDLPAGTVKIKLPDGTKIDINNKETVEFTISADDIKADGTIEIIALDEENVPLIALSVQTNQESISSGLSVLWWILGGFVALIIVIVLITYMILHKRKVG